MLKLKLSVIAAFFLLGLLACGASKPEGLVIADGTSYETSIYRQKCQICHGAEAEGRTLDGGKQVPSLRSGEHKFKTEAEIYRQISGGGNGMLPFRGQLSERELQLMTNFVYHDLRGN